MTKILTGNKQICLFLCFGLKPLPSLLAELRFCFLSLYSAECCRPLGNRWLGAHQMGNNSGDYLLYLLEVIDESITIM